MPNAVDDGLDANVINIGFALKHMTTARTAVLNAFTHSGLVTATAIISGVLIGISAEPAVASSPAQLAEHVAALAKSPAARAEDKQLAAGVETPALVNLSHGLLAARGGALSPFQKSLLEVTLLLGQPRLRTILAASERHRPLTASENRVLEHVLARLRRNPAIALLRREGERLERHPRQLKALIGEVRSERNSKSPPAVGVPHSALEEAETTFASTSGGQSLANATNAILSDPGAPRYIARQPPLILALLLPAKRLLSLKLHSHGKRPAHSSRPVSLLSLLPNCTASGAFRAALTTSMFAAKTYLSETLDDITKDFSKKAIKIAAKELLGRAAEKAARTALWLIFRAKDAYDLGNEGVGLIYNAAAQCGAVSLEVLPTRITRPAGYAQSYSFIAYDAHHEGYGAISPESLTIKGGRCDLTAETCESDVAGPHLVTATFGPVSGTAELIVQQADGTGPPGGGGGEGGGSGGAGSGPGGGGGGTGGEPGPFTSGLISSGDAHTCAIRETGEIDCWGIAIGGQLGGGTTTGPDMCGVPCSKTPEAVIGINDAAEVSAGAANTCALLNSGHVECWGDNSYGQLGDGTNGVGTESDVPVPVTGLLGATAVTISGGSSTVHACAVVSGGGVDCWGDDAYGDLGVELPEGRTGTNRPLPVTGLAGATAVSAGYYDVCAVLAGGGVDCWGANYSGQIGNGAPSGTYEHPVAVSGLSNAIAVSASPEGEFTCALLSTGGVDCWGQNNSGQLGNGTTTSSDVPVAVSGISNAVELAAGAENACVVLSTGAVECWGSNFDGDLGYGSFEGPEICSGYECAKVPVTIPGLSSAAAISSGYEHSCALLNTGTAECWGVNFYGELGNGTSGYYSSTDAPVPVIGFP